MNSKILKLFILLFILFLSGYSYSQEMNSNNLDRNFIKDSLEIHDMHKDIKDSLAKNKIYVMMPRILYRKKQSEPCLSGRPGYHNFLSKESKKNN